jgi:hypothetical protein
VPSRHRITAGHYRVVDLADDADGTVVTMVEEPKCGLLGTIESE